MLERKIKDPERWRTGFALFGAWLDDGYFVLWRRFHYRDVSGRIEACRFGKIDEYEKSIAPHTLRLGPPQRK